MLCDFYLSKKEMIAGKTDNHNNKEKENNMMKFYLYAIHTPIGFQLYLFVFLYWLPYELHRVFLTYQSLLQMNFVYHFTSDVVTVQQ